MKGLNGVRGIVLAAGALALCLAFANATYAAAPDLSESCENSYECCTTPVDETQIPDEDGRVDTLCVVGDDVYLGGNFQKVRSPGGTVSTRTFIAAVNKTTGGTLRSFNPTLNGRVYVIAKSPDDSTIYVGGTFTTVNGVSHQRIVAFDVSTGAVSSVLNVNAGGSVKAIAVSSSGNALYIGGGFTTVAGSSRVRLAKLTLSGGVFVLDGSWTPSANGGEVRTICLDESTNRVIVSGWFTNMDGRTEDRHITAVNMNTGADATWAQHTDREVIDTCIDNGRVFCAAGGGGGRAIAYDLATGNELWYYQTDGNCQAAGTIGGYPVFGFHGDWVASAPNSAMGGGDIHRVKLFMCAPGNGALQSWGPPMTTNTDLFMGVWALASADGDNLYVGGDYTHVSGVMQQRFAIFPVNSANHAPTWNANPFTKANATEDSAYSGQSIAGNASDQDAGDTLTFSKTVGPGWLSIAGNGALSGTPTNANAGLNQFTVHVHDAAGAAPADATMNITVINTNDAPTWNANPFTKANATEDSAYSGSISGNATDVDAGDTLTFSKTGGPGWLSIAGNGALSGTPTNIDVGLSVFTVHVQDAAGAAPANATMNVTVINTNDAPFFLADPVTKANATEDSAYSGSISGDATDPDVGDTRTFSKINGPSWLSVAANGSLSGTPLNANAGLNAFTVRVTDAGGLYGQATMNVTVINTNDAPTWNANPFTKANATQGTAYSGSISGDATDMDAGDTLTFSKVAGAAWLSLAANGALSGTPGSGDVGLNAFTVRVRDAAGAQADGTMNITVISNQTQVTFTSVGAEDGYVLESGETTNVGGTAQAGFTGVQALRVGDDASKCQFKTIVSFNTASIPDGATIISATLRLKRGTVNQQNPFTWSGNILYADIKGGTGFGGATALAAGDFQASADTSQAATMSNPAADGDWSQGSLNSSGLTKINKTGTTQLRVRFSIDDDNDAAGDYLGFYAGESAGNEPQLVVVYQ